MSRTSKKRQIDALHEGIGSVPTTGISNPFAVLRSIKKKTSSPQDKPPKKGRVKEESLTKPDEKSALMKDDLEEEKTILNAGFFSSAEIVSPRTLTIAKDPNSQLLLVKMKPGQAIKIKGCALVTAIRGTIDVLGYRISSSVSMTEKKVGFAPVFSPSISSHLVVYAYSEKCLDYNLRDPIWIAKSDVPSLNDMMSKFGSDTSNVILAFKALPKTIKRLEGLMPVYRSMFSEPPSIQPNLDGLYLLDESAGQIPLCCPRAWEQEAFKIIQSSDIPTVAVVGGRNHGKSTLTRYLVNRLLSTYSEVAFLDCDLGQAEFTLPGCVSLLRVNSPLLGPPCTHPRKPVHSLFVGSLHPKNDPDFYITCIFELVKRYRSELPPMPLVINTAGWVRGLGYDVLVHCLRTIQPRFIIQLQKSDFPSSEQLNVVKDLQTTSEETITKQIDIVAPALKDSKNKVNASDMRVLSTASYFFSTLSNHVTWCFDTPLSHQIPFAVPLHHVRIKFMYDTVPCSQALFALNGEIIALITDTTQYKEMATSTPLKFIPDSSPIPPTHQNCIGFGIIRHIDGGHLYIVTPLSLEELSRVNLVARSSSLELPPCLRISGYEHNWSDHDLPYTSTSLSIYSSDQQPEPLGAKASKSRPLGRKRLTR